jgi:hypothetical protein
MIATWEDFTSKSGFGDGELIENRDLEVRNRLVEWLNEEGDGQIIAVPYDAVTPHNPLRILVFQSCPLDDDELLAQYHEYGLDEVPLPRGIDVEVDIVIASIYETIDTEHGGWEL